VRDYSEFVVSLDDLFRARDAGSFAITDQNAETRRHLKYCSRIAEIPLTIPAMPMVSALRCQADPLIDTPAEVERSMSVNSYVFDVAGGLADARKHPEIQRSLAVSRSTLAPKRLRYRRTAGDVHVIFELLRRLVLPDREVPSDRGCRKR